MSSLARLFNPFKSANFSLAPCGRELFGTVVQCGVNRKTVTVKIDRFYHHDKLKKLVTAPKKFQVHDEEEYCKVGDKVVIRLCRPISKLKHYYVRNVVLPTPRDLPADMLPPKQVVEAPAETKKA